MASLPLHLAWAIALPSLASQALVLVSEGRQLKPTQEFIDTTATRKEAIPFTAPDKRNGFGQLDVAREDDFRPTTPGNSPGAGHSLKGFMQKSIRPEGLVHRAVKDDLPLTGSSVNDSKATGPRHSPGVGHSVRSVDSEPKS